jgi:hypothetical protein
MGIKPEEMSRIQDYLAHKFKREGITLKARSQTDDSVEVLLDGEFIGLIYKDDEDPSDVSYDFNMAILDADLSHSNA